MACRCPTCLLVACELGYSTPINTAILPEAIALYSYYSMQWTLVWLEIELLQDHDPGHMAHF